MTDHTDRDQRLADFRARLDTGEFAAAFTLDSEPTAEQLAAQRRDDFRLYGYAARVNHDPAVDFDSFLEDLWAIVASRFQLAPDQAGVWERLPRAWWDHAEDPSVVVWGKETPSRSAGEIETELERGRDWPPNSTAAAPS